MLALEASLEQESKRSAEKFEKLFEQVRMSLETKVMLNRLEDFVIREFQKLRDEVSR